MLKKATKKRLAGQWGYFVLIVIVLLLLSLFQAPTRFALIGVLVLGVLDLMFFLFQARLPCGVKNRRDGFCRNRGHGFLGGCSSVEGHRWIKLTSLFTKGPYTASIRGMVGMLSGKAAAISSGATVIIMLTAVLTYLFGPGPH